MNRQYLFVILEFPVSRFLFVGLCFVGLCVAFPVHAAELNPGDLIRASQPAVYYYSGNGKRYVFPNDRIYSSWFVNFDRVKFITDAELAAIPIGGAVTYKPGTRMVKVQSDPHVYAVARGGTLRWVRSEQVARDVYGPNWATLVHDLSDAFFVHYRVGTQINTVNDFSSNNEFASSRSIDEDLEYRGRATVSDGGTASPVAIVTPTPIPALPPPVDPCAQYTVSPVVPSTLQYVVLTRPMFTTALQPFIQSKSNAWIYFIDQIACTVSGADVQEKMRNFLRAIRTTAAGAKYVLLVGAPSIHKSKQYVTKLSEPWEVPIRYIAGIGADTDLQEPTPTDQYFATVDTDWPIDNPSWAADFDFHPNFFVGRIPVKTADEVSRWVTKTLQWTPPTAPRHSIFISAACANPTFSLPGLNILGKLTHRFINHNCSSDAGGDIADLSVADQADFVTSQSHGSYTGITKWPHTIGYELSVGGHGFSQKHPIMYVHGCEVAGMDYPSASMGQDLIGRADGVTAFIAASRSHWDIDFPFWQSVFLDGNLTAGEALYNLKFTQAKRVFLRLKEVENFFMFNLFGDPSLTLARPSITVTRESVDVPFSSLQEGNIRLTARVASSLSESVSGVLRYVSNSGISSESSSLTSLPPYTGILIEGGPWYTFLSQDWDGAAGAYLFPAAVGFTGCDFERMSCMASRVVVRATLPMQCGRPSITDGVKFWQVRFRGNAASVKLRLEQTPGYYCATGICPSPAATVLAEQTVAASDGATMSITWTKSIASEPLSKKFTVPYHFPQFTIKAIDALGTVIGSCIPSLLGEPFEKIL